MCRLSSLPVLYAALSDLHRLSISSHSLLMSKSESHLCQEEYFGRMYKSSDTLSASMAAFALQAESATYPHTVS